MHYNPFAYIHSEKDILKLVTTLIANTKGEGKAGDDFWIKAETLLYCALIGYIHYEAPVEEQNFSTLIEFINAMEVREDDEEFKNPVDLMFDALESEKPNHFAVRQYKKYKLAAGKTAKCKCSVPEIFAGKSPVCQQPSFPLAAKAGHQKAVCRRQTRRSDCRKYRPGCIQNRKSRKDGKRKGTAGRGIRHAPQEGFPDGRGFVPHYLYADEYHVLLLHDGAEHRFRSLRHHLSVG